MSAAHISSQSEVDVLEYLPRARTLTYGRGDVIYGYGQSSTHLYLVVRGSVKAGWFKPSNRWMTLETYAPDEVFGESVLIRSPCPTWAIAGPGTELMVWTAFEIQTLAMERPELGLALAQILARRLIKLGGQIRGLKLQSAAGSTAPTHTAGPLSDPCAQP